MDPLAGGFAICTRTGSARDLTASSADLVGRLSQHVTTAQALATDRAASVDTAIDPQQCLQQLRALGRILGGDGELVVEDLSRAPQYVLVDWGAGA
jgi:hypothetical protein